MTESVSKISGARETGRNSGQTGGVFKREKGKGYRRAAEDDNVDISKEASERAAEEKRHGGP
jgi:hypothetical protein